MFTPLANIIENLHWIIEGTVTCCYLYQTLSAIQFDQRILNGNIYFKYTFGLSLSSVHLSVPVKTLFDKFIFLYRGELPSMSIKTVVGPGIRGEAAPSSAYFHLLRVCHVNWNEKTTIILKNRWKIKLVYFFFARNQLLYQMIMTVRQSLQENNEGEHKRSLRYDLQIFFFPAVQIFLIMYEPLTFAVYRQKSFFSWSYVISILLMSLFACKFQLNLNTFLQKLQYPIDKSESYLVKKLQG